MPGRSALSHSDRSSNVTHTIFSLGPLFIEIFVCSHFIPNFKSADICRRLAIPAAFKVFFLFRERHSEQRDPTSSSVDIVISSVLVATMTVMATAWPFMNPVMGHLQPGWSTGAVSLSAQGISGKATRASDSGGTQSTTKHVARLRDPEVSDTTLISAGEYEDRQQSGNKWRWFKH
jgi:hypothetical protein